MNGKDKFMDKNKWGKRAVGLKKKLQFLRLDEDLEDDLEVEEEELEPGRTLQEDLKDKLARKRRNLRRLRLVLFAVAVIAVLGFWLYNQLYVFKDYVISRSEAVEVASGTKYISAGKLFYRYNSDGVSCVSRNGDKKWSITYNMQAPIADICDTTMAVAEQQGTQVYIVGEDGLIGNFETQYPILKVRVSKQGMVAVVQAQENITWINLYQADGTVVANDKTTIGETGYPMDVDLSPNGQRMAVSYLGVKEGILGSSIVFYDFGTLGQKKENNIISSIPYQDTVLPEIYFVNDSRTVAVADNGFYVFGGGDEPEQTAEVDFDEEIIGSFHDDSQIGFLFLNEDADSDQEYRMELYGYNGRRKKTRKMDATFDNIKIENDQILMYNEKGFDVFTKTGRLRFTSAYEKEVEDLFYFGSFRTYLVITKDSFDWIRIK
mgnify:CR=1 FL=1